MSNPLIIALDAGHGIKTPGKRCNKALDPEETREWQLNSRIVSLLEGILVDYDCRVIRIDDPTGQADVPLKERCAKANAGGADVYISIHHNAAGRVFAGGGTVAYHYCGTASGTAHAQSLYDHVVGSTGLVGNRSSKVVKKGYAVLAGTKMYAYLLENGYMDSQVDCPIIRSLDHAVKTAKGILRWLIDDFGLTRLERPEKDKVVPVQPPIITTGKQPIYRVQVGSFTRRSNAETVYNRLVDDGYRPIIKAVDGKYKIQVEAFRVRTNADALAAVLACKGYDTYITTA